MRSDIEIAQAATLHRIPDLVKQHMNIADDHLYAYGHHKAKLSLKHIASMPEKKGSKL